MYVGRYVNSYSPPGQMDCCCPELYPFVQCTMNKRRMTRSTTFATSAFVLFVLGCHEQHYEFYSQFHLENSI